MACVLLLYCYGTRRACHRAVALPLARARVPRCASAENPIERSSGASVSWRRLQGPQLLRALRLRRGSGGVPLLPALLQLGLRGVRLSGRPAGKPRAHSREGEKGPESEGCCWSCAPLSALRCTLPLPTESLPGRQLRVPAPARIAVGSRQMQLPRCAAGRTAGFRPAAPPELSASPPPPAGQRWPRRSPPAGRVGSRLRHARACAGVRIRTRTRSGTLYLVSNSLRA